jgi:hypothetical protein
MNAPLNLQQLLAVDGVALPDLVDRYAEARALADAATKELEEAKAALYVAAEVSAKPLDQAIVLVGRRFQVQLSACQKERVYKPEAMRALHELIGSTMLDLVNLPLAKLDAIIPADARSRYVETRLGTTRKTSIVERR